MRLKKGTSKPRYSLYLDIYYRKGKRKREFLGIYLEPNEDKTYRNEKLKLAENIKANPQLSQSLQTRYPSIISSFSQMKPEKKVLELSEDEKAVLSIIKDNSPIDLNELKGQTGLSNKKWEKAIKGLTKNKLARVEKTDAGLFVSLV